MSVTEEIEFLVQGRRVRNKKRKRIHDNSQHPHYNPKPSTT